METLGARRYVKDLLNDIFDVFHSGPRAKSNGKLACLRISNVFDKDLKIRTPVPTCVQGLIHADHGDGCFQNFQNDGRIHVL